MKIKIFADGADLETIKELNKNPLVKGFTTNPTLMAKAGVKDYEKFAKEVLEEVKDKPISFEVFSDEFDDMERQARLISSWGDNVYVKIPITNTKGESSIPLIEKLHNDKIKINITAVMNAKQARSAINVLGKAPVIVSIFAGRIADTGRDPEFTIREATLSSSFKDGIEILWASPREVFNVYQAEVCGADIITITPEIFKKLDMVGKDLEELSLDTVKMFYNDAEESGYKL